MKRLFLAGCIFFLLSIPVYGAQPAGAKSEQALIVDNDIWIDANRLLMFVTNTGSIAFDKTVLFGKPDGMYFPFTTVDAILDGSNDNSVVYASGLWIGALDAATGDTLICLAEYSDEFSPGQMVSGGPNPNPDYPELKVYKLYSDSMASNPNQDYFGYLTFAVPQGAPLNSQGEPDIIGDQFLWCVYNDADPGGHFNDAGMTAPIGLEVRQSVYAFDRADALGQVTYVRYRIFNKGSRNLSDMYISLWSDPDVGDAGDDLVGCDTLTSVGYCYNATNNDADYGANPPCVGYDLLQGPLQFTGNSADTGSMWGTLYPGFQNLALGSFNKYINGTDPDDYRETYQYMAGLDASQGGTPLPNGTRFAAPGDPVTATGDLDSNPGDRRFMLSNQPINLAMGDSTEIIFAIVVGQGADRLSSISVMRTVDEMAQAAYDRDVTAPAISISDNLIDFGTVLLGATGTDTLFISNTGNSPLSVTNIVSSQSVFLIDGSAFDLFPGESQAIPIVFTPDGVGNHGGELTISSNDPNAPVTMVTLIGQSYLPPDISVSPLSLSSSLLTGESENQLLTITNGGPGDLVYNISLSNSNASALGGFLKWSETIRVNGQQKIASDDRSSSSETDESKTLNTGDLMSALSTSDGDSSILIIQNTDAWGLSMNYFISGIFGITSTVINSSQIATTDFMQFDLVITVGDETPSYYNAISAQVGKFEAFVASGGIVQYQLATQGSNVSIVDGVNVIYGDNESFNRVLIPDHPIVTGLPELLEGNWANHTYLTNLPVDAQIITETSAAGQPTTVEYKYGNGTVIATGMTWEFLATSGYNSEAMLYNVSAYSLSLGGLGWISIDPLSGTIPAGGSNDIGVMFDATGLFGGDYSADIAIATNDPVTPELSVPAVLHVTGVPDIALLATSIDYSTVFVGYNLTDSVEVTNKGTDLLVVNSTNIDHTAFTADATAFNLEPGEIQTVRITFSPASTGPIAGILTFNSNDPDQPAISVALSGVGLNPPIVSSTPGFFDEHLLLSISQTIDRTLTIFNTGGSDLLWDVIAFAPYAPGKQTYVLPPLEIEIQEPDAVGSQVPTGEVWSQTEPLVADLLELSGVRILLDQYHSGIDLNEWSSIVSDLQARGATIDKIYTSFTSANLSGYDVLWLGEQYYDSWSASERTALRDWLIGGKGLLMEGDNTATVAVFNPILSFIGSGIQYSGTNGFSGTTGDISAHETTSGVDSIYLLGNVAHLQTIVPPAGILVTDIGGRHNAAYSRVGMGRVIVLADEVTINSHIGYANNRLFGNQAFDWLSASVNWLSFQPESGIVPQNSSTDITVHFDGEGLDRGDYSATIRVSSNDPITTQLDIPVHLKVEPYVCGDANLDGLVNIQDLDLIRAYYFICGPNPQPLEASDVDCDGSVGLADIVAMAKYIYSTGILNCCD